MKKFLKGEGFLFLVSVAIGLFFAGLNFIYYSPIKFHEHDSMSWILAGVAPILKIGVAYKDYWDRMPPGLALLTFLWAKIFGYTDLSFQILHFVSILALVPLFYLVFRKINSSLLIIPALASSILISFAPALMSYRLTSEQLGLLFALLGLVFLLYQKHNLVFISLSTLCLFLASQMKDSFGPTIISVVPLFFYYFINRKGLLGITFAFLTGALFGVVIITGYLTYLGNLGAYLDVLRYKQSIFAIFDPYRLIDYLYLNLLQITSALFRFKELTMILPLFVFSLIIYDKIFIKKEIVLKFSKSSLVFTNKSEKKYNLDKTINITIILFFILGNFLGFSLQGDLSGHRLIQMVFSSILFIFLVALSVFRPLYSILSTKLSNKRASFFLANVLTFVIVVIFTLPKIDIAHSYGIKFLPQKIRHFSLVEKPGGSLYEFIAEQTKPKDCILHYYGWGVDVTYYYSRRKPCTKFVKPILIMGYPKYLKELKEELKNNPPALIYYTTDGADVDVEKFESKVLNIGKIVNDCYRETERQFIYLPKEKDDKKFRKCYDLFF